jgi:hypothetical protein
MRAGRENLGNVKDKGGASNWTTASSLTWLTRNFDPFFAGTATKLTIHWGLII